jgi:hypothetical protein
MISIDTPRCRVCQEFNMSGAYCQEAHRYPCGHIHHQDTKPPQHRLPCDLCTPRLPA